MKPIGSNRVRKPEGNLFVPGRDVKQSLAPTRGDKQRNPHEMKSSTRRRTAGDALALRARKPSGNKSDGNHLVATLPIAPQGEMVKPSCNALRGSQEKRSRITKGTCGLDDHTAIDPVDRWHVPAGLSVDEWPTDQELVDVCEFEEDGNAQLWWEVDEYWHGHSDELEEPSEKESLLQWCENCKQAHSSQYERVVIEHLVEDVFELSGEKWTTPYNFLATSTINGNNGEWTNTDDFDRGRDHAERARARREARNHRRFGQHNDAADGHRPQRVTRARVLQELRNGLIAVEQAMNNQNWREAFDLMRGCIGTLRNLVREFGYHDGLQDIVGNMARFVLDQNVNLFNEAFRIYVQEDQRRRYAQPRGEPPQPQAARAARARDENGPPAAPAMAQPPREPIIEEPPEVERAVPRELGAIGLIEDVGHIPYVEEPFIGPVYYGIPREQVANVRIFFKDPDFNNGLFQDWRTDARIIGSGLLLATAFAFLHVPMVVGTVVTTALGVGTNEVAARTSQFVRMCLHDSASDGRFDTVLTGRPFDDDASMRMYRITTLTSWHSHFWAARGYTHYCDYTLPAMFLENTPGSASQVLSQCATEVGLVGIAKGTFGRSENLYNRFVELVQQGGGWRVEGVQPMFMETWNHYTSVAAFYLAQRQMVHNHEVHLLHGRIPSGPPPGFTGSAVNFR